MVHIGTLQVTFHKIFSAINYYLLTCSLTISPECRRRAIIIPFYHFYLLINIETFISIFMHLRFASNLWVSIAAHVTLDQLLEKIYVLLENKLNINCIFLVDVMIEVIKAPLTNCGYRLASAIALVRWTYQITKRAVANAAFVFKPMLL